MTGLKTKRISWESIFAVFAFFWFLVELGNIIAPLRHMIFYRPYEKIRLLERWQLILFLLFLLVVAAFVFYLSRRMIFCQWETRLCFLYALWLIASRFMHGKPPVDDVVNILDYLVLFMMMLAGICLDAKQRDRFLLAIVIVYCGFFVLFCSAGLFTVITNTYICVYRGNDIWIRVTTNGRFGSLLLLSTFRLISAPRVYLAFSLLVYTFIRYKKTGIRILVFISAIILYISIALFHSRTVLFSMMVSCGLLAVIVLQKYLSGIPKALRIPLMALAAAAAIAFAYLSYGWSSNLVSDLKDRCAPKFDAWYSQLENKADPDFFGIDTETKDPFEGYYPEADSDTGTSGKAEDRTEEYVDRRDISSNITLSGRTGIWKAGLIAVKRDPSILLAGNPLRELMTPVNSVLSEKGVKEMLHMHNGFLQILMLTGLPGLFLLLAWTALVVFKMIKCFFDNSGMVPMAVKALIIPLAGIFVFELTEVHVFSDSEIMGKVFFLIAGIFLNCFNEYFGATHTAEADSVTGLTE